MAAGSAPPKATSSQKVSKQALFRILFEKRQHVQIPVVILMEAIINGRHTRYTASAHILEYSRGGIVIDWDKCPTCHGYSPGEVDPKCVFAPHSNNLPDTYPVTFMIKIKKPAKTITFEGKPVYISRNASDERVGFVFTNISEDAIRWIDKIIEAREKRADAQARRFRARRNR